MTTMSPVRLFSTSVSRVPIASRAARDGLDPSTLAGRAPVDGSASAAATAAA